MFARWDRQLRFSDWGMSSQRSFASSRVLVCGVGALGSMVATLLVRAGVGAIRLVDYDQVEEVNLHRQVLFSQRDADIHERKVMVAERALRSIGSNTEIESIDATIDAESIDTFCEGVSLIIDALDNYPTRFVVNAAAVRHRLDWIHGAVLGGAGQLAVFRPGRTPCLQCLFAPDDAQPPTLAEAGILPPVVTTIASLQALEAMKLLGGRDDCVLTELISFDFWNHRRHTIPLGTSDPDCPICGKHIL